MWKNKECYCGITPRARSTFVDSYLFTLWMCTALVHLKFNFYYFFLAGTWVFFSIKNVYRVTLRIVSYNRFKYTRWWIWWMYATVWLVPHRETETVLIFDSSLFSQLLCPTPVASKSLLYFLRESSHFYKILSKN